jgi:hypothetical protein
MNDRLQNGLHLPTIELVLVVLEGLRSVEKHKVSSVLCTHDEDPDGEALLEAILRLSALSACCDVVEKIKQMPAHLVREAQQNSGRVMGIRAAEKAGTTRILDLHHERMKRAGNKHHH